jgi:glycosyltransferase involved in cell wall biosynthesis
MPRILFNMPSQFAGHPSGVSRTAFELLDHLIGRGGFDYILRSPWTREQLPLPLKASPLKVVTVPRPSILVFDVLRQCLTLPRYCRTEGIDLVVNLDPFGSAAGGRARLMIVHDLYFRTIPEQIGRRAALTNNFIFKLMLRGNSAIVTVSDATRRDLEYWFSEARGRATTIHSASSLQPACNQVERSGVSGRFVLAVGNATANKNFGLLAEAMAAINPYCPDVALVHVGSDPNEIIATSLKKLATPVRLIRLSGIDDVSLARLYRDASCLCVPSLYEGFCLPILEAQTSGCPVICANTSAMPEIAGSGAMLFDPLNPVALATCLKRILSEPDASETLIRSGYENVAKFSWDSTARQYEELFRLLLSSN